MAASMALDSFPRFTVVNRSLMWSRPWLPLPWLGSKRNSCPVFLA